mmetsp:Transcript_10728/g.32252  ORF Transcript_10728/g.32252 Transcript_10728/m.32252 type:complete len:123 (+) Transcript_10728:476-844(+)
MEQRRAAVEGGVVTGTYEQETSLRKVPTRTRQRGEEQANHAVAPQVRHHHSVVLAALLESQQVEASVLQPTTTRKFPTSPRPERRRPRRRETIAPTQRRGRRLCPQQSRRPRRPTTRASCSR